MFLKELDEGLYMKAYEFNKKMLIMCVYVLNLFFPNETIWLCGSL